MERPISFSAEDIRDEKVKIIILLFAFEIQLLTDFIGPGSSGNSGY